MIDKLYSIDESIPMGTFMVIPPRLPHKEKPKKVKPPIKKNTPITLIIPVDHIPETIKKEEHFPEVILDTPSNDLNRDTVIVDQKPAPVVEVIIPPDDEEPIIFADQMPVFGNCDSYTLDKEDLKKCSDKAILDYIHTRLKYPKLAREIGIEGTVVLRFIIDKKGKVKDVNLLRDLGAGCGDAAKSIVEKMPKWIPGKQNGKLRNVQFTIPIKFDLK